MTISIDTNVLALLWNDDDPFNALAATLLQDAQAMGKLVVAGPAYSELMAGPFKTEAALDQFFVETQIEVEWPFEEAIWREAGRAYRGYVLRRKKSSGGEARRILTDFLIGAQALVRGYTLLTLDARHYRAAFPSLKILSR